jgi:hypothetical protein
MYKVFTPLYYFPVTNGLMRFRIFSYQAIDVHNYGPCDCAFPRPNPDEFHRGWLWINPVGMLQPQSGRIA